MKEAILVTGASGFIGSHTLLVLLEKDVPVIALDNFSNSSEQNLNKIKKLANKDFPFYEADVKNFQSLEKIFKENNISSVIHFAGLKSVEESFTNPLEYYENNVQGSLNLINCMRIHEISNFIFSSSACVYGMSKKVPMREDLELKPTNPYGKTKVIVEEICKDLSKSDKYKFNCINLRYFNPIGAHHSGILGESPLKSAKNIIPILAKSILKEEEKFKIFGKDYDTTDGTAVRDYIHIMDLADGHIAALEYLNQNSEINIFENINLGTGVGYSVMEIINVFSEIIGKEIEYEFLGRREGDAPISYADTRKAKEILNWRANRDLYAMLNDAWKFYKDA